MKAAVLKSFDTPLALETIEDPVLGTGEVVVDVVAAPVLPYAREIYNGERKFLLELPVVPGTGAVGRVRAVGPDSTRLRPGDHVLCDPTVRARDDALTPDITLQALSAGGPAGVPLQAYFGDGSFAERMRVPTENAIPIGALDTPGEAARWCATTTLMVPYGGWLAGGLKAGETALVSGATGHFGSAAVMVALAMGAGRVVAPGRNTAMLDELARRFGPRVRPVRLSGEAEEDTRRMKDAAGAPVDCVLDILPPSVSTQPVRAAVMTLRPGGRAVLMGGVGMAGGNDLELSYRWIMRNNITIAGQWLFPRHANAGLIALVRSGLIDLDEFQIDSFSLDQVNEAVTHAGQTAAPFRMTIVTP